MIKFLLFYWNILSTVQQNKLIFFLNLTRLNTAHNFTLAAILKKDPNQTSLQLASGVAAPPPSQTSASCLSTVLLVSSLEPHRSGAALPDLITFMDVMDFFFMPVINRLRDCRKKLLVPFSVVFQLYGIMLWCVTFHQPVFKGPPQWAVGSQMNGGLSVQDPCGISESW